MPFVHNLLHYLFAVLCVLGLGQREASAQQAPIDRVHIALYGPGMGAPVRFGEGDRLEMRLVDEEELSVRLVRKIFIDANAVLIDDLLVDVDHIAELRYRKIRGARLKRGIATQGIVNIVIALLALLFGGENLSFQRNFLLGAIGFSALMVLYGRTGRRKRLRTRAGGGSYELRIRE